MDTDGSGHGKQYTGPCIIEYTAELRIDEKLDHIDRDRNEHERMEKTLTHLVPRKDHGDQYDNISDVPSEVCDNCRYVGIFMHDKSVYGPVIITQKMHQEKDAHIHITASGMIDISEQTSSTQLLRTDFTSGTFDILRISILLSGWCLTNFFSAIYQNCLLILQSHNDKLPLPCKYNSFA